MNTNDESMTREQIEEMNKRADEALAEVDRIARVVADAVADGVLVDCTVDTDCQWWLALTRAAHADCVAWTDGVTYWRERHEQMRMQQLVDMLLHAVRVRGADVDVVPFRVLRIPHGGDTPEVRELTMRVHGSWLIVTLPGETDPLSA